MHILIHISILVLIHILILILILIHISILIHIPICISDIRRAASEYSFVASPVRRMQK